MHVILYKNKNHLDVTQKLSEICENLNIFKIFIQLKNYKLGLKIKKRIHVHIHLYVASYLRLSKFDYSIILNTHPENNSLFVCYNYDDKNTCNNNNNNDNNNNNNNTVLVIYN